MSVAFSSEFESLCVELGASAHIVSSAGPPDLLKDGQFVIEHRPKRPSSGLSYHLSEIIYGLSLLRTARRFGADYAVLQSGTTHYFVMSTFRLFGIKVIPVLHNTLWPKGYPPTSLLQRVLLRLDSLFFKWLATATLGVSPACLQQVEELAGGKSSRLYPFTIQFQPGLYQSAQPASFYRPFRLLFAGRIAANKGVFDLLHVMQKVDAKLPGGVTLDICGSGSDLDELKAQCTNLGVDNIVTIHGWTEPEQLRSYIRSSHASIVPTRSGFAEGMAMTVIEPVLLGRPVITSPVVPALEVLRPACLEARTDDIESYANEIVTLAESPLLYQQLTAACGSLRQQFFDRSRSFQAALHAAICNSV
ncbi:glycosyltransferase family 4 protein [Bradyrhizobium sp. SRL28]|uniref:glycosyltransferase family 4 protein n=1 Tax=Bradyrhizobium sp. SRL28 TaxID=2836178 RepID=UPI001BDEF2F0|nr:glycosyltransferase family 4 protein [Bradyrhizobium sp. SRL28]MBT1515627.1 glycosyltransferase family 4 protein [Bradyrhizobium sp. SRL28]